ncbi:MAG TPA: NAD(P)-dependent oxidoreductase [Solirubrobacteraceae bacterium]|nr:NAD(P)-dependent oxidoreductase [Acidimicrobiales bacterium]HYB29406.1 NAD(P)-dependent oxidoreductase [Solirubrobacteraceae bacterium]
MHLAVVGMGRMGHAVAERLLGGDHEVTVWNRTPHKADDLVAKGAREGATPAAAAEATEATFTSLADDAAVLAVVTGQNGIAAGLGDGILIDASTVSPQTTADLAEAVSGRLLASPILGSPTAVLSGQAGYLIGGPRELYDRLAPAYDVLTEAARRVYVGEDARVATTLKLLSNYLLMSGIATLAETVATAQAVGLPDELIRDYLGGLPLVAPALRNRLDDIVSGDHDGWFSTTLGAKDVRLVQDLALSHGLPLPLADAVKRRFEEVAAQGWADADIGAVVELLRK